MKIRSLPKQRETVLLALIILFGTVISLLAPNFLTFENLTNILKAFTVLGVFSLGVLVVLVSGGIDVSFTAIAQVVQYAVVAALLALPFDNLLLAFLLCILFGVLLGLVNGSLIHFFGMPAIIVTIATQSLFFGLLYVVTEGRLIYEIPPYFWDLADARVVTMRAPNGSIYGLNLITVVWILGGAVLALFLRYTRLGRSIYAVGGNATAARRIGFDIRRTILFVYALMGAIAGIGGVFHVAIVQTVIPNSIVGMELQVIAAVVLGGASITGGRGSVWGTFLGVLLFAMLSNSLTLLRISSYYYNVFTGLVILLSIVANALQVRRQRAGRVRVQVEE